MTIHHPPAFCPTHGIFAAKALGFVNLVGASLEGCNVDCPVCGQMSEIVSGTYDAYEDRLDVLVSLSNSPAVIDALRGIARKLQSGAITTPDAIIAAERIAPGSGKLFDVAAWSDTAKATLYAAIIGGVALVAAAKISASSQAPAVAPPTVERVIDRTTERMNSTVSGIVPIPTPRPRIN